MCGLPVCHGEFTVCLIRHANLCEEIVKTKMAKLKELHSKGDYEFQLKSQAICLHKGLPGPLLTHF
jgi:hypothetical protein